MKVISLSKVERILDREPIYHDVLNDRFDTLEKIRELRVIDTSYDNETCKWESSNDVDFSEGNICFKIQCNHNPLKTGIVPNNFAYGDFKFCPFCGRKIEWV